MKKKKKAFALSGAMTIGTMVIAAPLSSIASESDNLGTILGDLIPGVYDVLADPNFEVKSSVDGSKLTLDWDDKGTSEGYVVSKLLKVDTEYILQKEVTVTTNHYEETVDADAEYKYRIVPIINGSYDLQSIGEEYVTISTKTTDKLTEVQLQQIDQLAKEYAKTVAKHPKVEVALAEFTTDISNDKKLFNDIQIFVKNELSPLSVKDQNELNLKVLTFMKQNVNFKRHLAVFQRKIDKLDGEFNDIINVELKTQLIAIAGETLLNDASKEFNSRFEKYLQDELNEKINKSIDIDTLVSKIVDANKKLTDEQLQKIDQLAKEYAKTIAKHPKVEVALAEFTTDISNDKKLFNDIQIFVKNELSPLSVKDQNELNLKVLTFMKQNVNFKRHLTVFQRKIDKLDGEFNDIINVELKKQLIAIAGETLLNDASKEFNSRFEKYLQDELNEKINKSIDIDALVSKIVDANKKLTDEQLQKIDQLAKEYAKTIANHPKVADALAIFAKDVANDEKLIKDLKAFVKKELTPSSDKDPNEVKQKILIFMKQNVHFKGHLAAFEQKVDKLDAEFDEIIKVELKKQLVEIAGEDLLANAEKEFSTRFDKHLQNELIEKIDNNFDLDVLLDNDSEDKSDEDETPVDEDQTPVDDDKTPSDDDKTPVDEDQTPSDDDKTPVDEDQTPGDDTYSDTLPTLDNAAPNTPKTGDGSIQKVASPLFVTLIAMMLAFVLTPTRLKGRKQM
ncbi:hypothetical protein [Viridibacillus arvi]|uniref:hypothetical protein n=1 Tax=Viridibacillus arvi TaxID=263475 RepID=UPI0034CDA51B